MIIDDKLHSNLYNKKPNWNVCKFINLKHQKLKHFNIIAPNSSHNRDKHFAFSNENVLTIFKFTSTMGTILLEP